MGRAARCCWWCAARHDEVTREELLAFFEGKIAKFWMPDDVVFVDSLPIGATGKIQKNKLREQYREHRLHPTSVILGSSDTNE
jgi:acyl-CoA synthetase (AMP-forming)/AMP-acid ligase II